jgi:hypothetical protein
MERLFGEKEYAKEQDIYTYMPNFMLRDAIETKSMRRPKAASLRCCI